MSSDDWMMAATLFVLAISALIVAVSFAVMAFNSVSLP